MTRLRLESSISKSNTYKNHQSHGVDRHHRSQELSDRKRSAGVFLIFSSGRKTDNIAKTSLKSLMLRKLLDYLYCTVQYR